MKHLIYTPQFVESLGIERHLWKYYCGYSDKRIANYTHIIYKYTKDLKSNPRLGHLVGDEFHLIKHPTRLIVVNNYYTFLYRLNGKNVIIGLLFSNRQDKRFIKWNQI